MKLWKENLMVRLVGYFLLLSLTITTIVGLVAYHQARQALRQTVFEHLNAVASLKEQELKRWVREQEQDFLLISQLPGLRTPAQTLLWLEIQEVSPSTHQYQTAYTQLSQYLDNVIAGQHNFAEIFLLTETGGKVIVSTEKTHEGEYRVSDSYFTEGKDGPHIQKLYPSPVTGKPTMTLSTPLRSDGPPLGGGLPPGGEERLLGVLAVHLNLEELDAIILENSDLGDSGELYLVDQFNVFVSGEEFPRGVHTRGIDAAVRGKQGTESYPNYRGTPVIGSYRWVEELNVALLAEMSQSEALQPARQLAWTILGVGLTSAVALTIGVYWLARQIAHPILRIAETAVQVAKGDLATLAPVTSQDEVGLLASSFNQMIGQLRVLYAGLEQKVSELQRTEKALQQYARRLEAQHEIDRAILKAQHPPEIAKAALNHLGQLVTADHIDLVLFDLDKQEATILAAFSAGQPVFTTDHVFPLSQIASIDTLRNNQPYIVSDLKALTHPSPIETTLLKTGICSYMSLPLTWRDQLLGGLNLASYAPGQFGKNATIAREVADQLAIAIQQAQLFAATQRQLEELSLLHAVATLSTATSSEDDLITYATEAVATFFDPQNYGVLLMSEDCTYMRVHPSYYGLPEAVYREIVPLNQGIAGWVARTGKSRRVADVTQDPLYYEIDAHVRSQVSVPLKVEERIIGVLNVASAQVNRFSADDERLLVTLAGQLATAIEKLRLLEKTQQEVRERAKAERALREARDQLEQRVEERTAELRLLNRASQTLISTLELDAVLETLLEELRNLLEVDACSVWLIDEQTDELICSQSSGPESDAIRGWRLPRNTGIVGWVVAHGESQLSQDAKADARHHPQVDAVIELTTRSLITVPLIVKGERIGALQALDEEVGRFTPSDMALMESLAATAAFAIENARLYKQARQDAETKSILLREVNHRVKNNLTAIIGILYAERHHAHFKNEQVYQSIMQDLINRVQGLATVHNLLSHTQWSPLPLTKLTTQVIYSSLRALPPDQQANVSVTPSSVMVTADQASNLALIINELVTNSVKYAMNGRDDGVINVTITEQPDSEQVEMVFADDGPGFPEDVLHPQDPRYNVGFHLIQNLVRRSLGGYLTLTNKSDDMTTGAVITICFDAEVQVGET